MCRRSQAFTASATTAETLGKSSSTLASRSCLIPSGWSYTSNCSFPSFVARRGRRSGADPLPPSPRLVADFGATPARPARDARFGGRSAPPSGVRGGAVRPAALRLFTAMSTLLREFAPRHRVPTARPGLCPPPRLCPSAAEGDHAAPRARRTRCPDLSGRAANRASAPSMCRQASKPFTRDNPPVSVRLASVFRRELVY